MLDTNKLRELLALSALTVGFYNPSAEFKEHNSFAITLNGEPILLVGWTDCGNSYKQANQLLVSNQFLQIVKQQFAEKILNDNALLLDLKVVKNSILENKRYVCLAEKKQGEIETGESEGNLVTIIPIADNHVFAVLLAVNNEIMKIFKPDAKDIPQIVRVKK